MEKKFFEVFRTLEVSDDDRESFEETIVTKLVSSSRHDKLHIYLRSDCIISKERIYAIEEEIRKQYFKGEPVFVKIIESFSLGDAYFPEKLIKQYKSSIIREAAAINPAWTDLLMHADFEFPESGDSIVLVLEDRFLACFDLSLLLLVRLGEHEVYDDLCDACRNGSLLGSRFHHGHHHTGDRLLHVHQALRKEEG